jgi:flagellar capping protein FliD
LSQMGDSITTMKKQMEKYEKEAERVDNQTKQRDIDVDRRFDEVMDKLNHMPEMMAAYNKKPETSQPAEDAVGWEADVEARN